jgi:prepilin-type processing-associated H-X9-DG protein
MRCAFANKKFTAAFNCIELLVVIATLAVLAILALAAIDGLRQKSRETACLGNLRQLGVAMSLYEKSNEERLPFAFVEYSSSSFVSWDRLIYSYVPASGQNHLLRCPSDTISAKGSDPRRTYSMPKHAMDKRDWPPASDNMSGVGLWWAPRGREYASLSSLNSKTKGKTNAIPAISTDMILSPDATMLLTEQAQANNLEFNYSGATVDNPAKQLDTKVIKIGRYHGGKFNYLMVDGHVEWLSPLESMGENDPVYDDTGKKFQNIWTISHD